MNILKKVLNYVLNRLDEPSTWIGVVVVVATYLGINPSEADIATLAEALAQVVAAILILWKQKKVDKPIFVEKN